MFHKKEKLGKTTEEAPATVVSFALSSLPSGQSAGV
jgi:hypothetical protein